MYELDLDTDSVIVLISADEPGKVGPNEIACCQTLRSIWVKPEKTGSMKVFEPGEDVCHKSQEFITREIYVYKFHGFIIQLIINESYSAQCSEHAEPKFSE